MDKKQEPKKFSKEYFEELKQIEKTISLDELKGIKNNQISNVVEKIGKYIDAFKELKSYSTVFDYIGKWKYKKKGVLQEIKKQLKERFIKDEKEAFDWAQQSQKTKGEEFQKIIEYILIANGLKTAPQEDKSEKKKRADIILTNNEGTIKIPVEIKYFGPDTSCYQKYVDQVSLYQLLFQCDSALYIQHGGKISKEVMKKFKEKKIISLKIDRLDFNSVTEIINACNQVLVTAKTLNIDNKYSIQEMATKLEQNSNKLSSDQKLELEIIQLKLQSLFIALNPKPKPIGKEEYKAEEIKKSTNTRKSNSKKQNDNSEEKIQIPNPKETPKKQSKKKQGK